MFNGAGATLTGRSSGPPSDVKGKSKEEPAIAHTWGTSGHTLGANRPGASRSASQSTGAGGASIPVPPQRRTQAPIEIADNSDDDYYDDGMDEDDVIDIDSD